MGLVIAAVIALPLAIWRSRVAQLQAETARRELSNRLYQQGTEMLASEDLSVRLDGIYNLERLAKDEPEQYHVQVMSRFCVFVRHPAKDEVRRTESGADEESSLREDVQAVMIAISTCHAKQIKLENNVKFRLELSRATLPRVVLQEAILSNARLGGADLSGARLSSADLSETWLVDANLSGALLGGANLSSAILLDANLFDASLIQGNLSGALLNGANLSGARFQGASLSGASLTGADLSGADFSAESYLHVEFSDLPGVRSVDKDEMLAKGLTQAQLDKSRADPDNPPELDGVLDAVTGKQLVWRGRPLDEAN
ncbi:MAG: pentapeptide repeat-containing protein [Chloroflexi bacterium]|nr:pentapeptide repeat-containing protein [Chloroflexota bacterium]